MGRGAAAVGRAERTQAGQGGAARGRRCTAQARGPAPSQGSGGGGVGGSGARGGGGGGGGLRGGGGVRLRQGGRLRRRDRRRRRWEGRRLVARVASATARHDPDEKKPSNVRPTAHGAQSKHLRPRAEGSFRPVRRRAWTAGRIA